MIGNFYFVAAEKTPTLIEFPTQPHVVEYILNETEGRQVYKTPLEADSLADAVALFAARIESRRIEQKWSVMGWVERYEGGAQTRLFLPNAHGKMFGGDVADRVRFLASGDLLPMVLAVNANLQASLSQTPSAELYVAPEILWAQTKAALEPAFHLVTQGEGETLNEYFVLPGTDERVGPSMARAGNTIVFENTVSGVTLERRVYEDGFLTRFEAPGPQGNSVTLTNNLVTGVTLDATAFKLTWLDRGNHESLSATHRDGRLTAVTLKSDLEYKTHVTFPTAGPHPVAWFSRDRLGNRCRVDRFWTPPADLNIEVDSDAEGYKTCHRIADLIASGEGTYRTEDHFVATRPGTLGEKVYAMYSKTMWQTAWSELKPHGFRASPLSTRQREIVFSLLGRSRHMTKGFTGTDATNLWGLNDDVVTCAFDVKLADPKSWLASGGIEALQTALGRHLYDLAGSITSDGLLWIGEIPVDVRQTVREQLEPHATSITAYPSEDSTGSAAVLVRCSPTGFSSEHGTSLSERESLDFRILSASNWKKLRTTFESFLKKHDTLCWPDRFDDLSKPMSRLSDFLQVTYLSAEARDTLKGLDDLLKPSAPNAGWGSATSFRMGLEQRLVPGQVQSTGDLLKDLPFARACQIEEPRACLYAGWAIPVAELTQEIVDRLNELPAGFEAWLAARDSGTLDKTAAVIVGLPLGSGLGASGPFDAAQFLARIEEANALGSLGRGSAQLVVGAQGGLGAGVLAYGVRQGSEENTDFQFARINESTDQWKNDKTDDGVLGHLVGQAGPYQGQMSATITFDQAACDAILAKATPEGKPEFWLAFRHGN